MDVILKQDVEDLGQTGEIVHVAPGYARNYLFPRELAVAATPGNLKNLEHFMASAEKKRNAARAEAQSLADKVTALEIKIEARAGERNRLFGSVTNQDITDFINAALDLSLDKKKVKIHGNIKMLGKYTASVTVYPGLTVDKEIDVVAATGAAAEAPAEEVNTEIAASLEDQAPRNDVEAVEELTVAEEAMAEEINEEVEPTE
jgi:large subunit ribosomal protein L9